MGVSFGLAKFKGTAVLLTYQGYWGVFKQMPARLAPGCGRLTTAECQDIVEQVRSWPRFQWLRGAWHSFFEGLVGRIHPMSASCCLEICTQTLAQKKELRVHGHLFLVFKKIRTIDVAQEPALKFLQWTRPHADL